MRGRVPPLVPVDAANNQVRACRIASQGILVKVLGMRLPPQTPEEIDAVDQDNCLVQSDIGKRERLADAVRLRDQIAIRQHHMDTSGMAPHLHRLVEIRQAEQDRAAIASRADNQHAERLPSAAH